MAVATIKVRLVGFNQNDLQQAAREMGVKVSRIYPGRDREYLLYGTKQVERQNAERPVTLSSVL